MESFPRPRVRCGCRVNEVASFRSQAAAMDCIIGMLVEAGRELGLGAPEPFVGLPVEPPMPEVRVEPVRVTRTRLIELDD